MTNAKMKLALFCLFVIVASDTRAFAQPDPNFHIYLCFGQSNMEGGGKIEERDRVPLKRFQVLKGIGPTGQMSTPTLNALGIPAVN